VTTTGITVTGTGSAAGVPDTTQLHLAAEAQASSVQTAVERASSAVAAMRSALLDSGVQEADLRSSDVSVHPDYGRGGPRAYVARFGLAATLHEVDASGAVAHAAVTAGGDAARLDGLTFTHSDPKSLRALAREAAFAEARAKADQLASLAGQSLGVIEEIVEREGHGGEPIVPVRMAAAEAADMAFDAGEKQVSVSITVRWAWA
jgi:uncharacterized protein YggE